MVEIRFLKEKFNARELLVVDDVFNLDVPRAKEIMDRIITGRFDFAINFTNGIRADKLDDDLLHKFEMAVFIRRHWG